MTGLSLTITISFLALIGGVTVVGLLTLAARLRRVKPTVGRPLALLDGAGEEQTDRGRTRIEFEVDRDALTWFNNHAIGFPREGNTRFVAETASDRVKLHRMPEIFLGQPTPLPGRGLAGALTALGLLGTFIGVSVSLFGVRIDVESGSAELLDGAKYALDGMRVAFFTSVAGLSGSLFWAIAYSRAQARQITVWRRAKAAFEDRTLLVSPTQLLDSMSPERHREAADALERASKSITQSASELDTSAASLARAAETLSSEAIGRYVGRALDQTISGKLVPVFEKIQHSVGDLAEVPTLIEKLEREVLSPLNESGLRLASASERIEETLGPLDADLRDLSVQLRSLVSSLGVSVAKLARQLTDFEKELGEAFSQHKGSFDQILAKSNTGFDEAMTRLGEAKAELGIDLAEVASDFKTVITGIQTSLTESATKQEEGINESLKKSQQVMNAMLRDLNKTVSRVASGTDFVLREISRTFGGAAEAKKELTEAVAGESGAMRDLAAVAKSVADSSEAVNAATAELIGELQSTLIQFFGEWMAAQRTLLPEKQAGRKDTK